MLRSYKLSFSFHNREFMDLQGERALEEQARLIQHAVDRKHIVQLGGAKGAAKGWGCCCAVDTRHTDHPEHLAQLRSSLGNTLAEMSAGQGLQPIGVVAYSEVRTQLVLSLVYYVYYHPVITIGILIIIDITIITIIILALALALALALP